MCTRFFIEIDNKELQEIIKTAEQFALARTFLVKYSNPLKKSGEIFPTNVVAAIAPGRTRDKAAFPMKWGFSLDGLEFILTFCHVLVKNFSCTYQTTTKIIII